MHEVRAVLDAVHAAAQRGHWCVGHVRYEAAPAFDAALQVHAATARWRGLPCTMHRMPWPEAAGAAEADARRSTGTPGPTAPRLTPRMAHIQQAIGAGELYQVNYTAPLTGAGRAGAGLVCRLQRAQPGGYAACIDSGGPEQVLSVSPELFFDWQAGRRAAAASWPAP
jgi:para-aminobenzoate synthetase/4-amino-4-deoxychorismate lyase